MKKRLQGIIIGIIIGVMVSGVVTLAKTGTEAINAWYSNIKICVNGEYITPTDANGNAVEPFTVNGTTYLPVRAIGNALGMAVDWDNDTKTVFLGEKPATENVATDTTSTIDKYIAEAMDAGMREYIDSMKKEGVTLELSSRGNSLIYACTIDISLSTEEIEEAALTLEESLVGFDASADAIFAECAEIQSVIVIYKDANGTIILEKEFNR